MEYVYLVAAIAGSIHVFTYGLWVRRQGNKAGAVFLFCLALVCVALPVYRLMAGPH